MLRRDATLYSYISGSRSRKASVEAEIGNMVFAEATSCL